MGQWANYFVATASAAAALTGLIFVSMSLNLKKILSMPHLPGRGLISLMLLTKILLISSFCLAPLPSSVWLGISILLICGGVCLVAIWLDIAAYRNVPAEFKSPYLWNSFFSQLAVLPYFVAGVYFIFQSANGYYWLIPAITFSFIKSLVDAWVLLIEINR